MSRSRHAAPTLLLCLVAGTGCQPNISGIEVCTHSEGCDSNGGGWNFDFDVPLSFNGLVTSATTGEPLAGVTVRVEAPARGWNDTALTNATGRYFANGLPSPKAGDCAGLSVSFSKEGYQPLRIIDFPQLTCGPGFPEVNASLTPTP